MGDTRPRSRGDLPVLGLGGGVIAGLIGFVLSSGVQLARMTSHGSASLEPTAGSLRAQWWLGRSLTLAAALIFITYLLYVAYAPNASRKQARLAILAIVSLIAVFIDLAFLGIDY